MPIEKGQQWGEPGVLPTNAPIANDDTELARLIEADGHTIAAVRSGDLARTLGVREPFDRAGPKQLLPIDALRIELDDGTHHWCAAHAVAGHPLRSRQFVAIMNAAFLGRRNIAPRAHPGDGKADVVIMRLPPGDRLKAWRRMPTGTHVPHPAITTTRNTSGRIELDRAAMVTIDGTRRARSRTIAYSIAPNAIRIAV